MKIVINVGGPAFPQFEVVAGDRDGHGDVIDAYTTAKGGMTLRDWFAGQALAGIVAGLCASPGTPADEPGRMSASGRFVFVNAASDAYQIAEAMLAAREARS